MAASNSSLALLTLLALLLLAQLASGQFFTKSSKSIPRMGRRSGPGAGSGEPLAAYRRALLELLDSPPALRFSAAPDAPLQLPTMVSGRQRRAEPSQSAEWAPDEAAGGDLYLADAGAGRGPVYVEH